MLVEERSSLSACGSVGILIYKETKETWLDDVSYFSRKFVVFPLKKETRRLIKPFSFIDVTITWLPKEWKRGRLFDIQIDDSDREKKRAILPPPTKQSILPT